jgi:hypothetical protein
VARLLDPMAAGDAELVIAWRPGARVCAIKRSVTASSTRSTAIASFDPGPVRAIRYPALVALGMSDRGDGWDVEMLVRGLRLGVGIVEVDLGDGGTLARRPWRPSQPAPAGGRSLFHILRHATVR